MADSLFAFSLPLTEGRRERREMAGGKTDREGTLATIISFIVFKNSLVLSNFCRTSSHVGSCLAAVANALIPSL